MATRSILAVQQSDGSYDHIYCHWDGDLVGDTLRKDHRSYEAAMKLLANGDHSEIVNKPVSYASKGEGDGDCVRYATSDDILERAHLMGCEYVHVMSLGDHWVTTAIR